MKLYLSSVGIPDPKAFRGLFAPNQTHQIALITDAWDNAPTKISAPHIEATRRAIQSEGFGCEFIDLSDYRFKPDHLGEALAQYAGAWVTGGNTFYLNWLLTECNFSEVLQTLFKNNFVYGGESAGAVVAGTTLHGIEVLDNILEAPHAVWQGMGLVPYGILPHWGEAKDELYLKRAYREMEQFGNVRRLANDDCIVVNDN
ncbi:MAG TPA: Type 1 glutamine amidotransferase-like domain-containing protein [Candidatus Saccharimonadales bacterium]|nr:Type 1 glutamine amidotransferase-like domain-containing protein [Candidatus Saccharimonadales bacterium]